MGDDKRSETMNKDVKIAAAVLAAIILVAILENSGSAYDTNDIQALTQAAIQSSKQHTASQASAEKSCYHNGIELKGKVQFVDSFPDLKVKFVSSFADINVQFVSSFPDDCGQWQEVSSFPDFTIQEVDSFPDIEVKKVSSFPGMN